MFKDGRRFLEQIVDSTSNLTRRQFVIGPKRQHMTLPKTAVWSPELHPGEGPLSAIAQWSEQYADSQAHGALVIACDYPGVCSNDLQSLIGIGEACGDDIDAVIPVINGRRQPLAAWYSASGFCLFRQAYRYSTRLMDAISPMSCVYMMFPVEVQKRFTNINDRKELEAYLQ